VLERTAVQKNDFIRRFHLLSHQAAGGPHHVGYGTASRVHHPLERPHRLYGVSHGTDHLLRRVLAAVRQLRWYPVQNSQRLGRGIWLGN